MTFSHAVAQTLPYQRHSVDRHIPKPMPNPIFLCLCFTATFFESIVHIYFLHFFFAYHYSSTQLFLSSLLFWNYSGEGHSATSCSLNLLTCKGFWLGNLQAIFLSWGDVILLKYLFTLIFLTKTVNLLRFYHPCAHSQVTHVTYFNPLNNSVK